MTSLIALTDAAALALHTVDILARNPDRLLTTTQIAEMINVSANHLSKVHQRLVKVGVLQGSRGPGGGFGLARPAKNIKLIEIVEAIDGPLSKNRCLLGRPTCLRQNCMLGDLSDRVHSQISDFFNNNSVADLLTGA